jgi:FO synthase
MGMEGVQACLQAGANDLGGTLINESITRAAGANHGQGVDASQLRQLANSVGRVLWQRTTLYKELPKDRVSIS